MVNPNQHDAVSQLSTIRTSADDAAFVALGVIIRPGAEPRPFDYHGATAGTRGAVGWPTAAGGVTLSWEPADPNVTRAFVAGDGRWRRAADALADLCTRVPCAG